MTSWLGAVERTVTGMGYDFVDAERSAGGLLRVTIDRPWPPEGHAEQVPTAAAQPFITVDDCERVTRQLQHVLAVEGGAYERLEVSSPGLDRPLKKLADYRRFVGESIELTLKVPFQGRKRYRGQLQAAGEGWRLLLDEDDGSKAPSGGSKRPMPKPAKGSTPSKRSAAVAETPREAMDFLLEEVRDARLVPVLDFKGRRAPSPLGTDATGSLVETAGAVPDDELDGGPT